MRFTVLVVHVALCSAFVPAKRTFSARSSLRASSDEFVVGVLGDLHIDPRVMEDYQTGREQWLKVLEDPKSTHGNVAVVSLGDLGESKSVRPEETNELFAGTTECHKIAAEYLGSFGVPYEVVGGNHGKWRVICFDLTDIEVSESHAGLQYSRI